MASFTDKEGREWNLRLSGPTIDLVRQEADPKFLLDDGEDDNTATRLGDDAALFCHVIFVLCKKQRDDRSVSLDDFYNEVIGSGEAIEAAGEALEKAIANFTPPRKREFIAAVQKKQRAVEDLAMAKALAKINDPELEAQILATLDRKIDAAIKNALTPPPNATSLPGSSESAPKD